MKKQLLLLLSLLAVSTATFAGCTTPTNDKEKTNVDKDEVIQERQNNEDDCEDGNCGSGHKFIQPRTPRIRKDRTTDENGDQVPPPCLPKEPHKDNGRHIPAPKPMPVPQPQN